MATIKITNVMMTCDDEYYESVEELYKLIKESNFHYKFKGPFIFTVAACLEYLLNLLFVFHANNNFPPSKQKQLAEKRIEKNYREKIDSLLPLLSGNKFDFDKNKVVYKTFIELIKHRNQLIHNKEFSQNSKVIYGGVDGALASFTVQPSMASFSLLSNDFVDRLYDSLGKFYCDVYKQYSSKRDFDFQEYMVNRQHKGYR